MRNCQRSVAFVSRTRPMGSSTTSPLAPPYDLRVRAHKRHGPVFYENALRRIELEGPHKPSGLCGGDETRSARSRGRERSERPILRTSTIRRRVELCLSGTKMALIYKFGDKL